VRGDQNKIFKTIFVTLFLCVALSLQGYTEGKFLHTQNKT